MWWWAWTWTQGFFALLFSLILLLLSNFAAAWLEQCRAARVEAAEEELSRCDGSVARVPVTVVTGFLGAGKTELLNRLLADAPTGLRLCVVENEAGAVSVDHALLANSSAASVDADVRVLANGCMCCSTSGSGDDLERTLLRVLRLQEVASEEAAAEPTAARSASQSVLSRSRRPARSSSRRRSRTQSAQPAATAAISNTLPFDHLIVELSGLADPAPVLAAFLRPALAARFVLDGCVCVVDAKHVSFHLAGAGWASRASEAARQVACADVVLLNKLDVAAPAEVVAAANAVRTVNPCAAILRTVRGVGAGAAPAQLLSLRAYELNLPRAAAVLADVGAHAAHSHPVKRGGGDRRGGDIVCAGHTADVLTLTLCPPARDSSLPLPALEAWLRTLAAENWERLFRVKGLLRVRSGARGGARVFAVQGVHAELQGAFVNGLAASDVEPVLVLIGRGLDEASLRASFARLFE